MQTIDDRASSIEYQPFAAKRELLNPITNFLKNPAEKAPGEIGCQVNSAL
jgi:hypothetical protein